MKVISINSVNFGSTGNIAIQIAEAAREKSIDYVTCCAKSASNKRKMIKHQYLIGDRLTRNLHVLLGRMTGYHECFSLLSTHRLIAFIDEYKPDIIHLHNLHSDYLNLPILFKYVKKKNITIIWTLHDCWSFTGNCPHFTMANCNKWIRGCYDCCQLDAYPKSIIDRTKTMWTLKRRWFTGVQNLIVVTPSKWLASLVKQSFLKEYPTKVINNGIDLSIFTPKKSDFRERHNLDDTRKIILGVAFDWGAKKGLDVFKILAEQLDPAKYLIVLVGTNEMIDRALPHNILSIRRTQNQDELAELYSVADVFVNPTREDTFPTVNIEALACGTPVITFETGGSPEIIDKTCGCCVPVDDIDALRDGIIRICSEQNYLPEDCIARAQLFKKEDRFQEYINLYDTVFNNE